MKVEVAVLGSPSLSPSPYGLCVQLNSAPQASLGAVQSVWARCELTLGRVVNIADKKDSYGSQRSPALDVFTDLTRLETRE